MRTAKQKKAPDHGPAVRIALTATQFALVSNVDWSFAYYECDWKLGAEGQVVGKKDLTLRHFVARRMGLDCTIGIDFRDGDKLNCQRGNLFATKFYWVAGTVRRKVSTPGENAGDPAAVSFLEEEGWLFGNFGLFPREGGWWAVHQPSGLSARGTWSGIKAAKAGMEAIQREFDLTAVDGHETWTDAVAKKCREAFYKYRENP